MRSLITEEFLLLQIWIRQAGTWLTCMADLLEIQLDADEAAETRARQEASR